LDDFPCGVVDLRAITGLEHFAKTGTVRVQSQGRKTKNLWAGQKNFWK
jgi:hypothetical protein